MASFFGVPAPVPQEMPRQLRPDATAATRPQRIATLESTQRYRALSPDEQPYAQGTLGWAEEKYGVVSSTRVPQLIGYGFDGTVAETMQRARERVLRERARPPTAADLRALLDDGAESAGGANDAAAEMARERRQWGVRHERDALLTLLVNAPRLYARECTFMRTAAETTFMGRGAGVRALFGASLDALVVEAPADGGVPRRYAYEAKCPYGMRAPRLWDVGAASGAFSDLARYMPQMQTHMHVANVDACIFQCWNGDGSVVLLYRRIPELWARTERFVRSFLAAGLDASGAVVTDAPVSAEHALEAKTLRALYSETTAHDRERLVRNRSRQLYMSVLHGPGEGEGETSTTWPAAYTCETVARGPAPWMVRAPGRLVAEALWERLPAVDAQRACAHGGTHGAAR